VMEQFTESSKAKTEDGISPLQMELTHIRTTELLNSKPDNSDASYLLSSAAGLGVGFMATLPGRYGMLGKTLAVAGTIAAASDSLINQTKDAAARDLSFAGALGAGYLLGRWKNASSLDMIGNQLTAPASSKLSTRIEQLTPQSAEILRFPGAAVEPKRVAFESGMATERVVSLQEERISRTFKRMIEEKQIGEFPELMQADIRKQIAELLRAGHKAEHLSLSKSGMVSLDREAIEAESIKRIFPLKD